MDRPKMIVKNAYEMGWNEFFNEKAQKKMFFKLMVQDDDTGMRIEYSKYPAGMQTPLHTHTCSHGIFVLEGRLLTQDGEYGPGSFVWWPEGALGLHGGTDTEDAIVLFITNKTFSIEYK